MFLANQEITIPHPLFGKLEATENPAEGVVKTLPNDLSINYNTHFGSRFPSLGRSIYLLELLRQILYSSFAKAN
jgi:hypothetical protein